MTAKGTKLTKEQRKNISNSIKLHWKNNYELNMRGIRKTAEKRRGKSWGKQSKYQKKIASKTHKGKNVSKETKEKMRKSRLKYVLLHPEKERERGQKCGALLRGRKLSKGVVAKMKDKWKDKNYRNKRLKQMLRFRSPNHLEDALLLIINRNKLPYKFVGNGKLMIDGFNPDFVNINNNKILIEVFGDYWHNRPDWHERDIRRLKSFKKNGYSTIIFWEHEIYKRRGVGPKLSEPEIVSMIQSGYRDMFSWFKDRQLHN